MTKKLNEIEILQELIRSIYDKIDPVDKFKYLTDKKITDILHGEKPGCFMSLPRIGQDVSAYLLPMCNRAGFEDVDIISLSIKLVQKLISDKSDSFDVNDLNTTLSKLQHKHNVFAKKIPHPAKMAGHKSNTTRLFNNIKNHLKKGQ
jgi:hypothetical protein